MIPLTMTQRMLREKRQLCVGRQQLRLEGINDPPCAMGGLCAWMGSRYGGARILSPWRLTS